MLHDTGSVTTTTVNGAELYYEVHGAGDPVLLLHGGFCSLEMMRPLLEALAAEYTVFAFERPGHGRSADVDGPIGYDRSVADTLGFMDAVGLTAPHVVGFSDGAIIGLLVALQHPDRIRSLVSISGNLDPSGFVDDIGSSESEGETADVADDTDIADSADITDRADTPRDHYDRLSPDGPEHADVVLAKLMHLWTTEPSIDPAELADVRTPTLVMAGDHDVIRLEHSALIANSVPGGQLCIVPGAGHGLIDERGPFVTFAVREFLAAQ